VVVIELIGVFGIAVLVAVPIAKGVHERNCKEEAVPPEPPTLSIVPSDSV
jgi:hypothetical protein